MKAQQGIWGIDLGQCGLKALRLQDIDGTITATAFDYVEYPKILSQPDADPDQLTRMALEKFLSRNTLKGDLVAISVPGQSGLARFVKLPPVEEKKITDIVRFEAKQQIPFNLDEVIWDYQKIGSGAVTDGFAMDTEIGLFAIKRDMVAKYLDHFKDVGVEIHLIQMAPLALCNFASFALLGQRDKEEGEEPEEKKCVVVLDIGTDSSNLVITDGYRIIWQRPIPLGGNHFTRALTKDLKLTFAKAEHLKRNATKSPDLKKILTSLKPVLNDFVSEVQRSLSYFTNTHRNAQIDFMVGLGNAFRLPGLQRFLEEKLQVTVKKLTKLEGMEGDTVLSAQIFTENVLTFAVAYGLALQGLKRARLHTNLLPPEIQLERLIRAKKPWAAAAAAALLLGLGWVTFASGLSYRAYNDQSVKDAIKKTEQVVRDTTAAQGKFDSTKGGALKEEQGVQSLVAGQQERLNWLKLTHFLGDCLPQPDGSNLSPTAKATFFSKDPDDVRTRSGAMSGDKAYAAYRKRHEGLKTAAVPAATPMTAPSTDTDAGTDLGEGISDLVQVNIEAVDSRFCDDLNAFWKVLREKRTEKGNYLPLPEVDKPPSGKGWVVELRGYTFHNKSTLFISQTLMDNLIKKGYPDYFGKKEADPMPPPMTPPTTPPTAPPPTPPMPPPMGAVAEKPPEADPVRNKVIRVVMFKDSDVKTSDTRTFANIGNGYLDGLLRGGGTGGPGGTGAPVLGQPPADPNAAAQGARNSWQPLGTLTSVPAAAGAAGAGGKAAVPEQKVPYTRTEFVILFIWQEPTPSDELRGMAGDTAGK